MGIEDQIKLLENEAVEIMKGAQALAERLREKEKAGQLKSGEKEDWLTAIESNVKKAQEIREEVRKLLA
jgi:hypothetical protein